MKYFVFDLGGVIVKPMNLETIYKSFRWKISFEEFLQKFTSSEEAIALHKGLMTTEEYFSYLTQFITDNLSFSNFLESYKKSKQGVYENVLSLLKKLKSSGNKVYLLSNIRKLDFDIFKVNYDITLFDELFLSYDLALLKPSKEIYEYVITKLNTSPENIYFFDDNIRNVEEANACGINAYQVTGENINDIFKKLNK